MLMTMTAPSASVADSTHSTQSAAMTAQTSAGMEGPTAAVVHYPAAAMTIGVCVAGVTDMASVSVAIMRTPVMMMPITIMPVMMTPMMVAPMMVMPMVAPPMMVSAPPRLLYVSRDARLRQQICGSSRHGRNAARA
jgi:hypothetical protein